LRGFFCFNKRFEVLNFPYLVVLLCAFKHPVIQELVWAEFLGFLFILVLFMATFVISKKSNGDFKFVFTSRKGKIIFTSVAYPTEEACEVAIGELKIGLANMVFVTDKASGNKYFFKITHKEKQLATSRKYTTLLLLQKGIDEIKSGILSAETLNFTLSHFVFGD
jgi:uncharacterized protein YegP (UPF0339 family)